MDGNFLAFVALVVLWIAVRGWSRTYGVRRAATRVRNVDNLLSSPEAHELRVVNAADFPWVNRAWYDERERELRGVGFEPVADLEDATLTRRLPKLRTFVRILVGEAGRVRAALYHVPNQMADIRTWELITELADGRNVITVAGGSRLKMDPPPQFDRVVLPLTTDAAALLAEHLRRLPDDAIRLNRTVEECMAAWQRQIEANAAFRRRKGGLSAGEMQRIAGGARAGIAAKVFEEVQRQNREGPR